MALPTVGYFVLGLNGTDGSTALNDQLAFLRTMPGGQAETELTIAAGSVTATRCAHTVDTEADAASDDLSNIVVSTNMNDGQFILLALENDARVVTLKHEAGGAGQLSLLYGADLALVSTRQRVLFYVDIAATPDTLVEVARFGFDAPATVEVNTAVGASPNVLTELESGKVFSNEGAGAENCHTLPAARAGLTYTFVVQDSDGIQVTASAGDTIRNAANVSGAGGLIEAATVGNVVTLRAINATEWIVTSAVGTWTVT